MSKNVPLPKPQRIEADDLFAEFIASQLSKRKERGSADDESGVIVHADCGFGAPS